MMTNIFLQTESASELRFEYMLHMLANHIHMTKRTPFYTHNLLRTVQMFASHLSQPQTTFGCSNTFFYMQKAASFTFRIIASYVDDFNRHTSYNYHTSKQLPCPMSWPIYSVLQRFIYVCFVSFPGRNVNAGRRNRNETVQLWKRNETTVSFALKFA